MKGGGGHGQAWEIEEMELVVRDFGARTVKWLQSKLPDRAIDRMGGLTPGI